MKKFAAAIEEDAALVIAFAALCGDVCSAISRIAFESAVSSQTSTPDQRCRRDEPRGSVCLCSAAICSPPREPRYRRQGGPGVAVAHRAELRGPQLAPIYSAASTGA
jgi:hypothetical protein